MVLDSSALVAILCGEQERDIFLRAIAADPILLLSAATFHEASVVVAARKANPSAALLVDEFVTTAGIDVVPFDLEGAKAARDAYLRFGRGYHPARLNLADCFSYALAKTHQQPLLFKGDDFTKTDIVPAVRL
jgi:ribonuclease VapC